MTRISNSSPRTSTANRTPSTNRTTGPTGTSRTSRTINTTNTFGTNQPSTATPTTERNGLRRSTVSTPNLDARVNGGRSVRQGAEGVAVRELQTALNSTGANLGVDGDFGPRTRNAVRDFQRANNLTVDGVVGPNTLRALHGASGASTTTQPRTVDRPNRTAPGTPVNTDFAPEAGRVNNGFANTRAGREQQAEQILRANGAWPPEEGRAYAIQIDQDPPPASASNADRRNHVRSYTGETSVFRVQDGQLREVTGPLDSASHPGQFATRASGTPDVNRDGRADVAHIRPGVYRYNTGTNGRGRFNPITNAEFRNSARDTNQDGTIDGSETNREHAATAIQIHVGRADGPSSVGCQTLPPNDYNRFRQGIREANTGRGNEFTYVLVRRPNDRFGANPY